MTVWIEFAAIRAMAVPGNIKLSNDTTITAPTPCMASRPQECRPEGLPHWAHRHPGASVAAEAATGRYPTRPLRRLPPQGSDGAGRNRDIEQQQARTGALPPRLPDEPASQDVPAACPERRRRKRTTSWSTSDSEENSRLTMNFQFDHPAAPIDIAAQHQKTTATRYSARIVEVEQDRARRDRG